MDQKQMKVQEFITIYNKTATAAAKEKLCSSIIKRAYVPVMEKYATLLAVYNKVNRKKETGLVYYNSISQYIAMTVAVIGLYTNLSVQDEQSVIDTYDLLQENNLIKAIYDVIGETELAEIEKIAQLIDQDVKENEINPYVFTTNIISRVKDIFTPENIQQIAVALQQQ